MKEATEKGQEQELLNSHHPGPQEIDHSIPLRQARKLHHHLMGMKDF